MRAIWLWGCFLGLAGCGRGAGAPPGPPVNHPLPFHLAHSPGQSGPLELIGGGSDDGGLVAHFLALAGGPEAAVLVVPLASGPDGHGETYRARLAAAGALHVTILDGLALHRASELAAIRQADGLFFPGGLPDKLSVAFGPYIDAARAAWQGGCAVGGTSAGAMVWGSQWLDRGDGADGVAHGLDAAAGGVAIAPGWGFLAGAIVDPHFTQRSRFYRLWLASRETRQLGVGVDESTALCVEGGRLVCRGAGTVTLLRPDGGASGTVRVEVLTNGQAVAAADWAPGPAPAL